MRQRFEQYGAWGCGGPYDAHSFVLISGGAQLYIRSTYGKWSKIGNGARLSGGQVAATGGIILLIVNLRAEVWSSGREPAERRRR